MRRVAEMLRLPDRPLALHHPGVLGDCFSDRRVETAIERVKLLNGDRGVALDGDFGYRLSDVAVIVHDL